MASVPNSTSPAVREAELVDLAERCAALRLSQDALEQCKSTLVFTKLMSATSYAMTTRRECRRFRSSFEDPHGNYRVVVECD
jgi:hypothetical protein